MSSNLRLVLDRVRRLRRNCAGWIACCPAHADQSPSLSINEKNGRILLHCFAGCTVNAVCDALGIQTKDLFLEPKSSNPESPIVRRTRQQIEPLRSRLTPRDRERNVTIVLATRDNPNPAFARALALSVEGELVQVLFKEAE